MRICFVLAALFWVVSCSSSSGNSHKTDVQFDQASDIFAPVDFTAFDAGTDLDNVGTDLDNLGTDLDNVGTGINDTVIEIASEELAEDILIPDEKWVVMTMNLHCHLDNPEQRMALVAQAALELDVDVLALQEVCEGPDLENTAETLLSLMSQGSKVYSKLSEDVHPAWDVYQEGIGLIFKGELLDYAVLALPPGKFERELLWARIEAPGGILDVAVTHLSFGADQAAVRVEQAYAIRNWLNAQVLPEAPGPVMLAGDFNCSPNSEPIQLLFNSGWQSSWAAVGTGSAGFTYPAPNPNIKIDYVMAFGGSFDGWTFSKLVLSKPSDGLFASDHLGIAAGLY